MKYVFAATVLSCLALNSVDAAAASVSSADLTAAAADLTATLDSVHSLASAGFAIELPEDEDGDEEKDNSPALPASGDADDDESDEDEEDDKGEAESPKSVDVNTRENLYSSAGLKYNKETDLPVIAQRKQRDGEELTPVPQVVACRSNGQVAITYSEGPSDATGSITRQLNKASTRANFFVNTKWLQQQQYAMVLQNIYNAGHFIGLTYRLPTEDPETMSDEEIKADIIKHAGMVESLIKVSPKYVRLHFTAQSDVRTEHILQELGFVLVGYNLDGKDYVHKTPELIEKEYLNTLRDYRAANDGKMGSFVSIQYDIPETGSMAAVPNILQVIEKEGYTPVRMDGCLNDAKPYKASAASLEYIADKFSFGSPGYKIAKPVASIINSSASTADDEMRGLAANDDFLNQESGSSMLSPAKITYALIPAFIYGLINIL